MTSLPVYVWRHKLSFTNNSVRRKWFKIKQEKKKKKKTRKKKKKGGEKKMDMNGMIQEPPKSNVAFFGIPGFWRISGSADSS